MVAELSVATDLPFLIASDSQLQEDLAYVCRLLDEPSSCGPDTDESDASSSDAAPRPSSKRKGEPAAPLATMKNKFEYRQKQEMYLLKTQVEDLRAKLAAAQHRSAATFDRSVWELTAREELAEKNKSLAENQRLRGAVVEQETFIEHMHMVLTKKPRLHMLTEDDQEEWRSYKLAAQQSLRAAAIHAIADRQLRRLQTTLIHVGVFNNDVQVFRAKTIPMEKGAFRMELVEKVVLPAPFHVVGQAIWDVQVGAKAAPMPASAVETYEHIDADTVYYHTHDTVRHVCARSNAIRKRYVEPRRVVVVWKSVAEDARMPTVAHGVQDDEAGWIEVVAKDETTSVLTMVVHVDVDPAVAAPSVPPKWKHTLTIDAMTTFMDKFSFVQPPPAPGMMVTAAPSINDTMSSSPLGHYFLKGKRFEKALKDAVNDAIRAHDVASPPASTYWGS
ncbi:Aste57867_23743 [Aphanomyces stellatus]|uniref:Aste57867_23743 protein n=1 Tax=Aphanomyces stellatus TaxID=120398 RepID=A0A485LPA7_9STRA|nr:hypothetical protein As57867_023671 [Aphanomyces stellatus]VFU00388.1 Aste57867_23743 [Aphanomyces stellatus]